MTGQQDHEAIRAGFKAHFKREPSDNEALMLHAVAIIETNVGRGWKSPEGKASHNLGAIQYKTPKQLGLSGPPYPALSPDGQGFLYQDTRPNADGTSTPYYVYFRRYPTLADGAAALARVVYEVNGRASALAAAKRGDAYGFSAAMRATGYYEGFGKTQADRIANHHKAMVRALRGICGALGKPMPGEAEVPMPTLRRGDRGEPVRALQQALNDVHDAGLVADGIFGAATDLEVRQFQAANNLLADGIVGPKTWAKLEELEG